MTQAAPGLDSNTNNDVTSRMNRNSVPEYEAEKFTGIFKAKVSLRGNTTIYEVGVDMDEAFENDHMVPHLKKMFIEALKLNAGPDSYDLYGITEGVRQRFIKDDEMVVSLLSYFSKGQFLMTPRI